MKIHIAGTDYNARYISYGFLKEFEDNVYSLRLSHLNQIKTNLSPEQFERKLDALQHSYQSGEMGMQGEDGSKYLKTLDGMICLVAMILQIPHQDAGELMVSHPSEIKRMIQQVQSVSFGEQAKKK
jgi:hypothetical protein